MRVDAKAKTIHAGPVSGRRLFSTYILVKFLHVTLAVLAGGTSASLGVWLEFMTRQPQDRAVVLRGIHRLLVGLVIPGLVVQALLGVWLVELGSWDWGARWIQSAMAIWAVLILAVIGSDHATRRLLAAHAAGDAERFPKWFRAARVLGGLAGFAFLAILLLMVAKI